MLVSFGLGLISNAGLHVCGVRALERGAAFVQVVNFCRNRALFLLLGCRWQSTALWITAAGGQTVGFVRRVGVSKASGPTSQIASRFGSDIAQTQPFAAAKPSAFLQYREWSNASSLVWKGSYTSLHAHANHTTTHLHETWRMLQVTELGTQLHQ